jgi:lipopolysaccharide/colanic/teichoic acid biosynthesis glycosyltransferase
MMRWDRFYVRHRSLLFDLWILARTPDAVLSRRGAV